MPAHIAAKPLRIALVGSQKAALMLVMAVIARPASATPARVSVLSDSACPRATAVAQELKRSLPHTTIDVVPVAASEVVSVVNGGDHYTIAVSGEERSITDPAHDCAERARVTAVFAAMVLDPPVIETTDVKTTADPSPPPGPEEPEARSSQDGARSPHDQMPKRPAPSAQNLTAWLSFGGLATWAGSSHQPLAVGPKVGLGVARGMFMLQSSVAITTPSTLRFSDAQVDVVRLPAHVSAYVRAQHSAMEGAVGVGLAVEGLHVAGRGDFTPYTHGLVQVGLRAAAQGRLLLDEGRAVFCEVTGTFVPSTYDLELAPDGVVGSTPAVWLGLTLGGTMGLL